MEAAILAAENEVAESRHSSPSRISTSRRNDHTGRKLRAARDEVARLYARWAELGEVAAASAR